MKLLNLSVVALAAATSFKTVINTSDVPGSSIAPSTSSNTTITTAPDIEARHIAVKHAKTVIVTHKKIIDVFGPPVSTETQTLLPHGRFVGTCRLEDNKCTYHWDYLKKPFARPCKAEDCPYDEAPCISDDNMGKHGKTWCDVPKHPELGLDLFHPEINPPKPCTSPMHKGQKTWVGPSCLGETPKPSLN